MTWRTIVSRSGNSWHNSNLWSWLSV